MIHTNKHLSCRSLTALLLVLVMVLSAFCAPAEEAVTGTPILKEGETEGSGTVSGTWTPAEGAGVSGDSAVSAYIRRAFSGSSVSAGDKYASVLGDRLTGANKELYDVLVKKMAKTAEGDISYVSFEVSYPLEMTLQSIRNDTNNLTAAIQAEMQKVFEALIGDCAAEQYWFDKVRGVDWSYTYDYNSTHVWLTNFYPSFNVAAEYSQSGSAGTYYMKTTKAKAIQTAAKNAKEIVSANSKKSDSEKLKAYKNKICELTDYNWSAVENNVAYGNPWQLVWVFDGDPNTKVVCEGYSKAFQYLWELSSFNGDITSMLMTGNMLSSNGSGGAHMWNVVTMSDGRKYLVDVTNCDTGSTGNDTLFLVGYDSVEKISGSKAYRYGNLYYIFDQNVSNLYKKEDRDLSGADYDPGNDVVDTVYSVTVTNDGNGLASADPSSGVSGTKVTLTCAPYEGYQFKEWQVLSGGVTIKDNKFTIGTADVKIKAIFEKKADPEPEPEPEPTFVTVEGGKYELNATKTAVVFVGPKNKNAKKLVIQSTVTIGEKNYKVTGIAAGACQGMSKLTTLTIGKNVKTIGSEAFYQCKKLKTIKILGTALKKAGENAFGGVYKKAVVTCPKKKVSACKKLLQKAGLPKTAKVQAAK